MNAAVHGKASLAELLMADSATPGKKGDDDKDQTNTVDFGATLMTLIDQSAPSKNPAGVASTATASANDSSRVPANAARNDPPGTNRLDASPADWSADLFTKVNSQSTFSDIESSTHYPESESAIAAAPTGLQLSSRASNAYHKAVAESGNNHELTTSAEDGADSREPKPAVEASPDQNSIAGLQVAEAVSVPDRDIVLDFRKQNFPLPPVHDATSEQVDQGTSPVGTLAKVANLDHSGAATRTAVLSKADAVESSDSKESRTDDGTSPALSNPSNEGSNGSNMNSSGTKMSQDHLADASSDANSAAIQQAVKGDFGLAAEITPQQQRTQTANPKESSQTTPALNVSGDNAPPDAAASSHPAAVAPLRPSSEITATQDSSRNVNLTVQLADGQAAQASVRQHAGVVDVKILTPSPASAQRVSSELDAMRQNMSAAGIELGHAEVTYQHGDGRQEREQYQAPAQQQASDGEDIFVMDEVAQ
jgi:hypothetical protein